MRRTFLPFAIGALLASSVALAQTGAPTAASASVAAACKDGTSYSGATLKGACRGHGGVDKKAASKASAASTGPAASMPTASSVAPAAGGGAGKVWVNNNTKVYHCPSDKYYGKTKNGAYMSEADAKAKGFHPDHGKSCQ